MDPDTVKRSLEGEGKAAFSSNLPDHFFDQFILHGLRIDAVEHGRVLCSLSVPPRLSSSSGGYIHGGVITSLADVVGSAVFYSAGILTSGVSLEISVSFVDVASIGDEIDIEGKLLRAGKSVGVTSVDFVNKKTRKTIAQARHTKYLAASSRL
ncbi:Thioesterase superfamily protein [Rhynchospora pubera]|uniref:Acyl-coenzyme A thioesterase 13 n=1 Tax=Rhynchospora pubera TaxID=906938 RepID=A0AAV8CZS2_9POAL|nr:Thioesterase superfamily protein [Rhynchospora pubera]